MPKNRESREISVIGSAIGNCGRIEGCELAPTVILNALAEKGLLLESHVIPYKGTAHDITAQTSYFQKTANLVTTAMHEGHLPLLLGGDHSCAIGSWAGVSASLNDQPLGLIWIDAHMDAHRPETSISGNLHGMPVAHLLGYGHAGLSKVISNARFPVVKSEHLVYFGIRSYEPPERELLESLGVKVYYQESLDVIGFRQAFLHEYERLCQLTGGVGISLDLDGLDAEEIQAVGTPEGAGIHADHFISALQACDLRQLRAFEIAEYNPTLDGDQRSLRFICTLVDALVQKLSKR